jgi:site-specific DNA recombinase
MIGLFAWLIIWLYRRVSSPEQKKKGVSINAQKEAMVDFLKCQSKAPDNVLTDDGHTASVDEEKDIKFEIKDGLFVASYDLKKRPAFRKMLENVDKFDELYVWKWDRFLRYAPFHQLIRTYLMQKGKKVIATHDTNDELGMSITGMLSERESTKIKERMLSVNQHRFNLGLYVGNHKKKGYKTKKRVFDGKEYSVLTINELERKMIEDIFDMTLQNCSYKEIIAKWKINPQSYYNAVKDKFYAGYIHFEGQEKRGIHDPIISLETFNQVQEVLKRVSKTDS